MKLRSLIVGMLEELRVQSGSSHDRVSAIFQLSAMTRWMDVPTNASSPTAMKSPMENPKDMLQVY